MLNCLPNPPQNKATILLGTSEWAKHAQLTLIISWCLQYQMYIMLIN